MPTVIPVAPGGLPPPWRARFSTDTALAEDVTFLPERPRGRVSTGVVFAVTVVIAVSIGRGAVAAIQRDLDGAVADVGLALAALLLAVFSGIRFGRALSYRPPAPGLRSGTIVADDGVAVTVGDRVAVVPAEVLRGARTLPFGRRVEVLVAEAGGEQWVVLPIADAAQRAIAAWVDAPGTTLRAHL